MQPLGVQGAKARQMGELGLSPVEQLQHHELGHVGHPLLTRRGDALGEAAGPLGHEAG